MVNNKERMKCVGVISHDKWECECVFTYSTGRIKRMRNPKKIQDYHRKYSVRLKATKDKFKLWDMLWYQNQEFSYPITRWNRH